MVPAANLWQAFGQIAERRGREVAIQSDEVTLSFAELMRRSAGCRAWLRERGVQRHDRVLIWTENAVEIAVAVLGVWGADGIAVLLDANEREAHLAHAIAKTVPRMLLHRSGSTLPEGDDRTPSFGSELWSGNEDVPWGPSCSLVTDPASIVFTSGSTGLPKGVTQSHGSLLRGAASVGGYLGLSAEDRILSCIPWSFDYGYGQLLSTLTLGPAQILPSGLNVFGLSEAVARHRPTVLPGIPTLFAYLTHRTSPLREVDRSSVRLVTNTGGTMSDGVLRELLAMFPRSRVVLNYGLTESYRTSFLPSDLVATHAHTIGRAVPGVEILILREDGSLAEPMEVGEIVHRGDFLCMGYWNDPEATARALRPDPRSSLAVPNPRPVLFTGDLGYLDEEGFLHFKGRRDHQIKSMGVRVSPGEIEVSLAASELLVEVGVFGLPSELLGDEVWAAVVFRDSALQDTTALAGYAKATMSRYMVPRRYLVKDRLPKTRTGKVDYRALKDEASQLARR